MRKTICYFIVFAMAALGVYGGFGIATVEASVCSGGCCQANCDKDCCTGTCTCGDNNTCQACSCSESGYSSCNCSL